MRCYKVVLAGAMLLGLQNLGHAYSNQLGYQNQQDWMTDERALGYQEAPIQYQQVPRRGSGYQEQVRSQQMPRRALTRQERARYQQMLRQERRYQQQYQASMRYQQQYQPQYQQQQYQQQYQQQSLARYQAGMQYKQDRTPGMRKTAATIGGARKFVFDPNRHQWTAYSNGQVVASGRASGGKHYCPDTRRGCKTPVGHFRVVSKGSASCKSSKFPIGKGGAPMPYCMFFRNNYAVHGSYDVPGYNASHGCIRVTPDAAQWLSSNFMQHGTSVVVLPY